MGTPQRPEFTETNLGRLPVDRINKALELELEWGDVVFTRAGQSHAFGRHPAEFLSNLAFAALTASDPLYVGDDVKNPGKIELIRRMPGTGRGLLLAIVLSFDEHGHYVVASMYSISDADVDKRRLKNLLVPLPPK